MKTTISKRDLAHVATRMVAIADKKSTLPALSQTLLRTDGRSLVLSATDLYQSLTASVAADVAEGGAIAVSAKDLDARVKVLPDGPVELSTTENALVLKSRGTARKFTMRAMRAAEYPPLPQVSAEAPTLKVDVAAFAKLLTLTAYCVSQDETRPHINSLLLEWDGDILRAVSTDGHRLAKAEVKTSVAASTTMLLPLKAVREVQRICDELYATPGEEGATPALTLVQSGSTAFFIGGGATFSVKLVDAQFPPYRQVIPQPAAPKLLRAPRAALADAVRAVSVAANEKTLGVKMALSQATLCLSSESADSGEGLDEVAVEYSGENMSAGFNAQYLGDVLRVLGTDEVELTLDNELAPIVVKPIGETGFDYVAVVMPMRI